MNKQKFRKYFGTLQCLSNLRQVKQTLISSITNSVDELLNGLLHDLRVRVLGNQEIFEKYKI